MADSRFQKAWRRFRLHLSAEILDHGVLRRIYANRHRVCDGVERMNQPSPRQLRRFAAKGGRTVINLRGSHAFGSYFLERESCQRYGLRLIEFRLYSRRLPSADMILELDAVLRDVERPVLIHCKSGADRAGLGSALFLMLVEGVPVERAKRQLSLRYLYVRESKTGLLDAFLESYETYNRQTPTPFLEWVRHHYDERQVRKSFRSRRWADVLTDRILRRE